MIRCLYSMACLCDLAIVVLRFPIMLWLFQNRWYLRYWTVCMAVRPLAIMARPEQNNAFAKDFTNLICVPEFKCIYNNVCLVNVANHHSRLRPTHIAYKGMPTMTSHGWECEQCMRGSWDDTMRTALCWDYVHVNNTWTKRQSNEAYWDTCSTQVQNVIQVRSLQARAQRMDQTERH